MTRIEQNNVSLVPKWSFTVSPRRFLPRDPSRNNPLAFVVRDNSGQAR
jgi:hypothetical protein